MMRGLPVPGGANVQYAKTADGLQIAVSAEGQGRTIVYMPLVPWITLSMAEPIRQLINGPDPSPIPHQRSVTYDVRGSGLSEGAVLDLSIEAQLTDLSAAIDRVSDGPVTLLAPPHAGPAAIAFAARHPERLSALVLWGTYARGRDFFEDPRVAAVIGLVDKDWNLFTDALALQLLGWEQSAAAAEVARMIAENLGPREAERAMETLASLDVTELLPEVRVPTLVVGRLGPYLTPEVARGLAQGIPGARLAYARGSAFSPLLGDSDDARVAIERFLEELPIEGTARPALRVVPDAPAAGLTQSLTAREQETLQLSATGLTNDGIAERLGVSVATVKKHLHNTNEKLGVRNRTQAVARARELGLLDR
jgi:DNA-binding CsgD family transcriptional regulator/pimeloyl-ACP methyl ester carboxylesterase